MKASTVFWGLWSIVIIVFILVGMFAVADNAALDKQKGASIGKTIVVQKDTLEILDYNPKSDSYILSNGLCADREFVEKILH